MMKRVRLLDTLDYDPMHPENVAARAMDPDDGIDYEAIILEMIEDEREGREVYYFPHGEGFLEWLDQEGRRILAEIDAELEAERKAELGSDAA